MRALLTAAATLTCLSQPVWAEELILKCWFDWVCDPNRTCTDAAEDIRFRVNVADNTVARIGGNQLSSFELISGDRALTVLERPISGGVTATTMLLGNGAAVHSENAIVGRDLETRQYVGECVGV